MCGFLGLVGRYDLQTRENFITALDSINHRGPDSSGLHEIDGFIVGHKRLSIVDLNSRSDQPFSDGENWLLFNGEIYNFMALRTELSKTYECDFKTDGDTEVLFLGLKYEGVRFLSKVDGMFALCFISKASEVVLARDKFGQKPLFYGFDGNSKLIFGSELSPVLQLIEPKRVSVNIDAFKGYFQYGASIAPATFYNNVYQVCPGEAVWTIGSEVRSKEKWVDDSLQNITRAYSVHQALRSRLTSCLVADTPIAFLSSGGVDSSSLIKSYTTLQADNFKLPATSVAIHLKTKEDQHGLEIAKRLQSNHLPLIAIESEVGEPRTSEDGIKILLNRFREPFADTSYFYSEQLYSAIPKAYKVVIGGDGADEMFMGYKPALFLHVAALITTLVPASFRKFIIQKKRKSGRFSSALFALLGCRESLERLLMGFSSGDLKTISTIRHNSISVTEEQVFSGSTILKFYNNYLLTRLSNVFLRKSDHASMRFSKELRSPYLQGNSPDFILLGNFFRIFIPKLELKRYVQDITGSFSAFRPKVGFNIVEEDKKERARIEIKDWCFDNKEIVSHFFDFDSFLSLVQDAKKYSYLFRIRVLLVWIQAEYEKEKERSLF